MREFDYIINRINMEMLQGEEDMFFGKNLNPSIKGFHKGYQKKDYHKPLIIPKNGGWN